MPPQVTIEVSSKALPDVIDPCNVDHVDPDRYLRGDALGIWARSRDTPRYCATVFSRFVEERLGGRGSCCEREQEETGIEAWPFHEYHSSTYYPKNNLREQTPHIGKIKRNGNDNINQGFCFLLFQLVSLEQFLAVRN